MARASVSNHGGKAHLPQPHRVIAAVAVAVAVAIAAAVGSKLE
jgi:hypothetical protein